MLGVVFAFAESAVDHACGQDADVLAAVALRWINLRARTDRGTAVNPRAHPA